MPLVALEQQLQAVTKGESGLADHRTLLEDYQDIRKLSERWHVPPKRMPFQKFVISCLGTTSAGKSSFINYFYRTQCKKSAVSQLDTHYTVVETVPAEEFAKFSPRSPQKFTPGTRSLTAAQLAAPLEDPHADPRYGTVFVHLDTAQTLARYSAQFSQLGSDFSNYGLVTTVLVNEVVSILTGRITCLETIRSGLPSRPQQFLLTRLDSTRRLAPSGTS